MKSVKQLACVACLLISLSSCGGDSSGGSSGVPTGPVNPTPTSTAVTGVSINKNALSLVEGGSETLIASITPSTALNKSVSWSSSDTSIASIDANGVIIAKKPGTVTITVTTVDGNKTATLTLTVTIDYITRQKKVLVALYDAMGGNSWTKKDGWKKDDVELKDWYGITMEGVHVISINLSNNNLKGKLPASLGETLVVTRALVEADTRNGDINEATTRAEENIATFGYLRELDLSNNEVTGSIPPEFGNLTQLNNLNLSENKISGSIPSELGNLSGLTNLDLSENNISGTIPPEVGNLSNLTNLDLGSNNISGDIPAEVGNLKNLTNLDLGNNKLTGSVPDELGNLENLESLNISENHLSGEISIVLQESDMWQNLDEEPDLTQQDGTELEKEVEITIHVIGVALDKSTLELTEGETATLSATITPSDASSKTVYWSSNNENIATVNRGVVKAVGPGTATITVKTKDGGKTATCSITVNPKVADINGGIDNYGEEEQGWGD